MLMPGNDSSRITTISAAPAPRQAMTDVVAGFRLYPVWTRLAFHEIRQQFRRSLLGPFWLTLSMGIMIGAVGLVFSTIFQQNVGKTLPYIATGIIFWGLLTNCINEGTDVFIGNEAIIRNVPIPISVHVYKMLARNLIIFGFNMVIYITVLILFQIPLSSEFLWFIPGFVLFIVNISWMGLAAAILSTRFRDIPQVIANLIQVGFFLTPVFWSPSMMPHRPVFVTLNPFYHLLEIVRGPLLGQDVPQISWIFDLGLAVAGLALTTYLYRRTCARIAYWV